MRLLTYLVIIVFWVGSVEMTKAQEAPFSASLLDQLEEQLVASEPVISAPAPSASRLPIRLSLDNYWSAYLADSTNIERQQSIFTFQTAPEICTSVEYRRRLFHPIEEW